MHEVKLATCVTLPFADMTLGKECIFFPSIKVGLNWYRCIYVDICHRSHRGQWWGGSGSSLSKMATPGKRAFFQERVSHTVHLLCNRNLAYDETFSLTVIQRLILCEDLCLYVDMNVSKWLMMRRALFSKTAMMRRTHLVDEEDSHKRCVNDDGCKVAYTTV